MLGAVTNSAARDVLRVHRGKIAGWQYYKQHCDIVDVKSTKSLLIVNLDRTKGSLPVDSSLHLL
jgi:hypothetical protein